jgi:predicted nucleotidyltransferase
VLVVRDIKSQAPPARFLLRLPAPLHRMLIDRAETRGLSLNEYITRRLAGPEARVSSEALTPILLARARAVVGAHVVGGILHGSWSRGDARRTSDVDALIVVDGTVPLTRALYRKWDEEPIAFEGRTVDVHFAHMPRFAEKAGGVWCEAAIEGHLLADTDGRVDEVLRDIRRAIADGRLVRKHVHGQPYWTVAA